MSTMTWADVMANPHLKNLPFKIELNQWGRIEMTPAGNDVGLLKVQGAFRLGQRVGGQVLMNCSIATSDGVRVADAAWVSDARLRQFGDVSPFPRAPEICVEVKPDSGPWDAMHVKARLYLEAGAQEVWIEALDGERRVLRD